jgi:hypothetical protein
MGREAGVAEERPKTEKIPDLPEQRGAAIFIVPRERRDLTEINCCQSSTEERSHDSATAC